jgi:F0F1-type ATP synthase membrane subunit b/b'
MEWDRAQADMKRAIIEVAAVMSEKILKRAVDREIQDEMYSEAMAELEGTAWRS